MKRSYLVLGLGVVLAAGLVLHVLAQSVDRGDEAMALLDMREDQVMRMLIREGSTGGKVVTEDPESIGAFLDLLEDLSLEETRDDGPRAGWSYYVDLYLEDGSFIRVDFAGDRVTFGEMRPGYSGVQRLGPVYEAGRDPLPEIRALYRKAG